MPKISYQEIVTPDISESGLILHEWKASISPTHTIEYAYLEHLINGLVVETFYDGRARQMWKQLCQSK